MRALLCLVFLAGCHKPLPPAVRASDAVIVTRPDGDLEGHVAVRIAEQSELEATVKAIRVKVSARGESTAEAMIPQQVAVPLGKDVLIEVHVPLGNALTSALRTGAAGGQEVPFKVTGFVDAEVSGQAFAIPFAANDAMPRDVVLEHIRRP